jgi:RimJ/RimL family protein N-acetyltransferase
LGRPEALGVEEIASAIAALAADAAALRRMSQCGRLLVDGQGSFRVWLHLREDSLKLRPVAESDCRLIYDWANDPDVRAVSFDSAPIPWETHEQWFRGKLANPQVKFWLAADASGQPVGMVRFEVAGAEATISISLAASARGRSLGALLIWAACRRLFREQPEVTRVLAWIKPDNEPSKRAFQKAGFLEAARKEVKGQPALVYELQRA